MPLPSLRSLHLPALCLLASLANLTACRDTPSTAPQLAAPGARTLVACLMDNPDNFCDPSYELVDLTQYPVAETMIDTMNVVFGDIPPGEAAMSATYDRPPSETDCWLTANLGHLPSCSDGPCYSGYLESRLAYREQWRSFMSGTIAAGLVYVTTAGQTYRIVKAAGAFVTGAGFVGWSFHDRYKTALAKLDACININNGYYRVQRIY